MGRKVFMESETRKALDRRNPASSQIRQVLVIAPGFDTISYRLSSSYPDVQFWEVDHPATGKVRQRGLNALGSKPSNMHLLLADLTKHNLADFLSGQDGFDVSAPTVVIIEGLLPYLEKEHAKNLFIEVSKSVGL